MAWQRPKWHVNTEPRPQSVSLEQMARFVVFVVFWPPPVRGIMALTRLLARLLMSCMFIDISWQEALLYVSWWSEKTHNAVRKESHYFMVMLCFETDSMCPSVCHYILTCQQAWGQRKVFTTIAVCPEVTGFSDEKAEVVVASCLKNSLRLEPAFN